MKKLFKGIAIFFGTIFLLVYIVLFLIYTPFVQKKAIGIGSEYLKKNLGLTLVVDHFSLKFPLDLSIKDVEVSDSLDNKLLDLSEFRLEVMLWPLFKGIVKTDSIHLSGISVDSRDLIEAVDFQGALGQFVISDTEVIIFFGEINIDNVVIKRFKMDMSVQ